MKSVAPNFASCILHLLFLSQTMRTAFSLSNTAVAAPEVTNSVATVSVPPKSTTNKPIKSVQRPATSPRTFRGTLPFFQSPVEREFLAGVGLRMSKYSALLNTGSLVSEKYAPAVPLNVRVQRSASGITLPGRVLQRLTTPITHTVQEGLPTVSVDPSTGEITRNGPNAFQAALERASYLVSQDLQNVREGIYPLPSELKLSNQVGPDPTRTAIEKIGGLWEFASQETYTGNPDYENQAQGPSPTFQKLAEGLDLPEYYQVDFHSVPGGFLDPRHPPIYDNLSETVFVGCHFMSRRMTLRPVAKHMQATAGTRPLKLLDLGTGNGSYLGQVREAFPSMELHGVELSPAMIEHAEKTLNAPDKDGRTSDKIHLTRANMEDIPMADNSMDVVTVINCFHEMPEHAIANTAKEIARVLKPGGLAIHMDATQRKDDTSMSSISRITFDAKFNEPYMRDWMENVDLDAVFANHGLIPQDEAKPYFVSTLRCFRKPSHSQ